MLRFGLIVDETVICGLGPDATANLFTASSHFAGQHSHRNDSFLERYHEAFGTFAPPVSAGSIGAYEGLHVLAGFVRDLGTFNSRALARALNPPKSRRLPRHMLADQPTGTKPTAYLGEAEGATLSVVGDLAH